MASRSYANLMDLSGEAPLFTKPMAIKRGMTRSMTVSSLVSESRENENAESVTSDPPSSICQEERLIIVANILPIICQRESDVQPWKFQWNEDSILLQLKYGMQTKDADEMEVIYVGSLSADIDPNDQDEVAAILLRDFKCVPTFLSSEMKAKFYHGFCKQQLWPLFHYMLPLSPDHGGRFDNEMWRAYVSANKIFADKVMEVINPEEDFVWVHDYHLMVLPTFLRKRYNKVKLGFFLHSPFPSSEIYRTLPVRDEILRALLNTDLIGFHTFDYARHFLSCCSRMLGLEFQSKRGHIGLEYYGRTVGIKILPVGIRMERFNSGLDLADTEWRIGELKAQFDGKTIFLGVDDMDIFKGISLKLLAMESLLNQHPEWVGKAVLVQIANPARGKGKEISEVRDEVYSITKRINDQYGSDSYQPVVILERHVPLYERIAFYTLSHVCVVTAVRDGMNLVPYEYIVCREGRKKHREVAELKTAELKIDEIDLGEGSQEEELTRMPSGISTRASCSMLVVSEFIGCSPSLSGALRVNPWNTEMVADAMYTAITMPVEEQSFRHEKHYRYVSTHDVGYWAQSFMTDFQRICREHIRLRCYGIGFGLGFRTVALDLNFRKLQTEFIVRSYQKSTCRAILLDYDGTLMPQASLNKAPSAEVVQMLNSLCSDPKNVVFIVSGRKRANLSEWFSSCTNLGIAAEHGYFFSWNRDSEWSTIVPETDFTWKDIALPVLSLYTESTDGSYIDVKESAVVWHHSDADPDFGSWQAKELLSHLESVLASEPVVVKIGHHIVEVKPQGVSKGLIVEHVLSTIVKRSPYLSPDFVLCVGDDRSDEDMFEKIESAMAAPSQSPVAQIFACTVGQKPSKARYYLDDTNEVIKMCQGLAMASEMEKKRRIDLDAMAARQVQVIHTKIA